MASKKATKRRKPRVEPLDLQGPVTPIGVDPSWSACAVTALELEMSRVTVSGDESPRELHEAMVRQRPVWQVRRAEVISTKPGDYACGAERLEAMGKRFRYEVEQCNPFWGESELVAIEGYAMGAKFGREQAGELCGHLKLLLWQAGVPYLVVPPTSVKKYVTGKGVAPKELMLKEVYRRWGYDTESNDQADAYALARIAAEFAAGSWTKKFDELAQGFAVVGVRV